MDKSALELIQQTALAAAAANRLTTPVPAIILNTKDGQEVESLEHLQEGRSRFRGVFSTPSFDDFTRYVDFNNPGTTPVFVDVERMSARAFFNLGDTEDPGHADFVANLSLKPTAAFSALSKLDGTRLKQKDLAEFLEDWNDFISADYTGGDGSLNRAITAIRKLTIKKQGESVHGITATSASRSEMEQIEAQSDELPLGFTWVCEPYVGLKQRTFRLALSVITTGEVPLIVLRWQRREAVIEEIAKEFRDTLSTALGGVADVTVGTFNP